MTAEGSHILRDRIILRHVERGDEHIARAEYGDHAVDNAIRGSLEADGWDPDACVAEANGIGP